MSEMGGEIYGPDEGGASAAEGLSEEAQQRFAAAAAARKQIRKEEKKSKQKDDQVAQVIIKFLGSKQHTHLFVLVSRLVARDCPSIFILAILSLIHDESAQTVEQYLQEQLGENATQGNIDETMALTKNDALDADSNAALIRWINTVQQVVAIQPEAILRRLMIDEKNLDGTVLQLTSFVIQEFMASRGREAPFEKIQPLTASILQTTFQPYMADIKKKLLAEKIEREKNTDDD